MSDKKSILQEAIAEAKTIREAAMQNAYKALEENVTPSIKEMLAKKLDEELNLDENEEEDITEDVNAGFKKVSPKKKATVKEAEEDEKPEDDADDAAEEPESGSDAPAGDEAPAEEPDGDEDGGEANGDHAEPDGDEPAEEGPSDDTPISDLTVGELKDLIASAAAVPAEPAPEGDLGADMDPGQVDGQGEEAAPLEGEPESEEPAAPEANPADNAVSPDEENDDEIDLSELLKELETESSEDQRGKPTRGGVGNEDHEEKHVDECKEEDPGKGQKKFQKLAEENNQLKKDKEKLQKELDETYSKVGELKDMLAETNLLNSKLMHTVKLTSRNLSESQKAHVIKSLDSAKNLSEVKVIYKTLCESLAAKPGKSTMLKEHRMSTGSSAAGRSTAPSAQPIVETDFVRRMQQLAGIRK